MLNNRGATTSSATDQLGRAYNQIGHREMSKVGNEYAVALDNVEAQQEDLDADTALFRRHYGESKVASVNSIVQEASSKLAALNAAAQNASLPDRIAIEQEKARIRNNAMGKLSSFDSLLNKRVGAVRPSDVASNRAEASRLLTAGVAPENSFDFTSEVPVQFQDTGPFASNLPIFVGRRDREI